MKRFKHTGLFPALALAGVLFASGAASAATAERPVAAAQPVVEVSGSAMPVYYTWHHHRYSYRYRGRYYNHRSWKNGGWRYY